MKLKLKLKLHRLMMQYDDAASPVGLPTIKKNLEVPLPPPTKYRVKARTTSDLGLFVVLIGDDDSLLQVTFKKFLRMKRKGKVHPEEVKVSNEITPLPDHIRKATPPQDFFGIRCGEDRVQIMSLLCNDGSELLCWHGRLHCSLHLKAADLHPKPAVAQAIAFLKSIDTKDFASINKPHNTSSK